MLDKLEAGSTILSADGEVHRISNEIAEQFRPGDRLITSSRDGLLLIPEVVSDTVKNVIDKSVKAFDELATASDEQIVSFFCKFANALETNQIWDKIKETNPDDGYNNFARVTIHVSKMDILLLHHLGHRRIEFKLDGKKPVHQWLAS